jgi:hypothetical protein
MDRAMVPAIESIVRGGKAVMMAEDGVIVAAVQDAVLKGRSATFYLSRAQFTAVNKWYWTPQMISGTGLLPVPLEERNRIRSELGIEETGLAYSNRIACVCGRTYGSFEFMQQGLREHGLEAVQAIFSMKDAAVIRVNPNQETICPDCKLTLLAPHYYCYWSYGCCRQPM